MIPSPTRIAPFVAACLAVVATACATPAPAPPASAPPEIDQLRARIESDLVPALVIDNEHRAPAGVEQRMEQLGVPGLSLAFFDGGEVVWTQSYGLADVESGRPVTPETRFQAASISKPVSATAALDLVEDGVLALDTDINEVLTSWQVPVGELTAETPVTLRGLLTHTAGTTVHGFPGYGPDEEVPTTVGVLEGSGNTDPVVVDLAPRTEERYSGGGYTVMQLAVEDATGQPFHQVMAQRVLRPLGMDHSTYEQPLPAALADLAATGYRAAGIAVPGRAHTYPELAAAGLWTTPTDLAVWAIALQTARSRGGHPVLDTDTVRAMTTPDTVGDMGLGPGLPENATFFAHGGANDGFQCYLTAQRDGDEGIAVMTNSNRGVVVALEVVRTVAAERGWAGYEPTIKTTVLLDADQRGRLVGFYRADEGFEIEIRDENGRMVAIQKWNGTRLDLAAESPSELFDRRDGTEVTFELGDDGAPAPRFEVQGYTFERAEEDTDEP